MQKILIIEDEPKISALLERGFRKNSFVTTVTSDGAQAIQAAQTGHYAAILLDSGLRIKDGWTVLKELRERGDKHPVIVVTASNTSRQEALAAGASDCMLKPFLFQDLLAVIHRQSEIPKLVGA